MRYGDAPNLCVQVAVAMYGVAKSAPARRQARELPPGSAVVLWTMDEAWEWAEACREGAQFVVTNLPLSLLRASRSALAACQKLA